MGFSKITLVSYSAFVSLMIQPICRYLQYKKIRRLP